jgi:diguanylate cyclase (GGDEF)-like protein
VTRKKSFALAGSVVVAIAIGLIDLITGSEVSVALFYLVPIALATWYVGPRAGLLSCLFVIAVRVADNWIEGHHFSHPVTPYWNTGIELGFFLVATSLLTRLHAALAREACLARTDPLTGSFNRRAFWELATRELARAQRTGQPVSLAYLDVDDFKRVNDQAGHATGDLVLAQIATTLRNNLRAIDVVARIGGDEFLVLFPDTNTDAARTIVTKLTCVLRDETFQVGWPITVSIGAVTMALATVTIDQLIGEADALAYAAKRDGKHRLRPRLPAAGAATTCPQAP